ncbi:YfiR family protein [Acinetobacter johnsonii]|uniref:YfiR family protein n=1 Tax=Acinetobacter johnsonii TaxID=40214 RepID=UPI000EBCE605|nr:DUF4154 domain-containing protein [Acinetobacter johnsonii]
MTAFKYKIYLTLLSCLMISQVQAQPQLNLPATTLTILSYVRWNTPNPISLCILNNSQLSNQFIQVNQQLKSAYQIQAVSLSELNKIMCNAVFFSTYTPREEQNIINNLKDAPLTFSSNNTECELGSAFCLYQNKTRTSFKVNLASLSQSQARVDPRVLLLAKSTEP